MTTRSSTKEKAVRDSGEAGEAVVVCDGNIVANYGGEDTTISLGDRAYLTVLEDGEWKMCGYESR